jgi:membrane protease YdiL (CAAX protease family)
VGSWAALAITALIFALSHLAQPHATPAGAIAVAVDGGIVLAAMFVLTRSLWPCVGVHWAWNVFEGPIYGAAISGTPGPSVFDSVTRGPAVWTGGAFGPEAVVVAVVVSGATLRFCWRSAMS